MHEQGRYTVCEEIASGSTATVYLAEDRVLRRKVALKRLHPHLLNHPETVKRFEKEAVAVAMISHENIIRVYDYGNEDRNLYLAMEYVDGSTLECLLDRWGAPLPGRVCHSLFHQLMKGLAAAHALGIIHRDIKPSNLLVDRNGLVRIADFGIAFLAEEKNINITKTGAYLGTPVYSAPEQAMCRPATTRSDIFSSGILCYRCLTGKLPFEGDTPHAILTSILEKAPVKASLVNPRVLPGFPELIRRMLDKDPEKRPTAADCLQELEALAERHGMPIEPGRIRRFTLDGRAYAAEENRELAVHYLSLARQAEREGRPRQAAKLAAQAELHGPVPAEARQDIRRLEAAGKSSDRRRATALAALTLAALGAGGLGLKQAADGIAAALRTSGQPVPPSGPASTILTGERGKIRMDPPAEVPGEVSGPLRIPVAALPEAARPGSGTAAPAAVGKDRPRSRKAPPPAQPSPVLPGRLQEASAPVTAGFLMVKTNPPFAKVSLGGRELGVTPFTAPIELAAGSHELRFEREGCLLATSTVVIEPGRTSVLRLALTKAEGATR